MSKKLTDQRISELRTLYYQSGVEELVNSLFDIPGILKRFNIGYYKNEGTDENPVITFQGETCELLLNKRGEKNSAMVCRNKADILHDKVLAPFDIIKYIVVPSAVDGKNNTRTQKAANGFAFKMPEVIEIIYENEWEKKLVRNDEGGIELNSFNVSRILCYDPIFEGLRYNEWTHSYIWNNECISEEHYNIFVEILVTKYHMSKANVKIIIEALPMIRTVRSFDPLVEYLDKCYEDYGTTGTNMIDHYLQDYLGADDNEVTVDIGRLLLVGAVARAYQPGIKFDTMFIFKGVKQGMGKSSLVNALGAGFGCDSFTIDDFKSKDNLDRMRAGAWLSEIPEMAGIDYENEDLLKAILSRTEDVYRPAYGRTVEHIKRRTVFIGTINKTDDLFSDVKNRRFIIIPCDEAKQKKYAYNPNELTPEMVRQMWGQAIALYRSGEYDPDSPRQGLVLLPSCRKVVEERCEALVKHDISVGPLQDFLCMPRESDWDALPPEDRRKRFTRYIGDPDEILKNSGKLVEKISINEIMREMFNKDLIGEASGDKLTIKVKRELQRLGYVKGKHAIVKGYGTVQMFVLKNHIN